MYAYVGNDPINARDPSGRSSTWNCASIRDNYYSCLRCCYSTYQYCRSRVSLVLGVGELCIKNGILTDVDPFSICNGYDGYIKIDMTYCYDSYIFCLAHCANRFLPPGETPI